MGISIHALRESCKHLRDQVGAYGEDGQAEPAAMLNAALTLTAGVLDGMTNEDRVARLKEALWIMEGQPISEGAIAIRVQGDEIMTLADKLFSDATGINIELRGEWDRNRRGGTEWGVWIHWAGDTPDIRLAENDYRRILVLLKAEHQKREALAKL